MRGGLILGGVLLALTAAAWFRLGSLPPVATPEPASAARGRVAVDPASALALADSICDCDTDSIRDDCRTRVLFPNRAASADTASTATARPVLVLLHGFTNCPKQFDRMAHEFVGRGYVVVVPLLPRHGAADRMTTELSRLTAEELTRAGTRAVDVASALGRPVTVVGLSSSAVLAAWLAEHRDDVDAAVLIAPALGPKNAPPAVVRPLAGALLAIPNFYVWWDSKKRENLPGPRQCYPRFASRALAEVYRLGAAVLDEASRKKPHARIVIVTTEEDEGVSNELASELSRRWHDRGAAVRDFRFRAGSGVHHDMIDPDQPYQRVEQVYPVLASLIAARTP